MLNNAGQKGITTEPRKWKRSRRFYSVSTRWANTQEHDAPTVFCALSDLEQHAVEVEHPVKS